MFSQEADRRAERRLGRGRSIAGFPSVGERVCLGHGLGMGANARRVTACMPGSVMGGRLEQERERILDELEWSHFGFWSSFWGASWQFGGGDLSGKYQTFSSCGLLRPGK